MSDLKISGSGFSPSLLSDPAVKTAGSEKAASPEAAAGLSNPKEKEPSKSLHEMMQEAREKAEKRRDSLKLKQNPSQYGDAAMTAYARLARARSQSQVSAAAGYARRQISRLQGALRTDGDNAQSIKAAIRQLQKAVGRAGKKKRELQREDVLKARQRKAQAERQRRRAAGLQQELNRQKTQRSIRESGYLREAEIDNRLQAQLAATRLSLREQAQALSDQTARQIGRQEYAAQSQPVSAESTAAPETAVDVQA